MTTMTTSEMTPPGGYRTASSTTNPHQEPMMHQEYPTQPVTCAESRPSCCARCDAMHPEIVELFRDACAAERRLAELAGRTYVPAGPFTCPNAPDTRRSLAWADEIHQGGAHSSLDDAELLEALRRLDERLAAQAAADTTSTGLAGRTDSSEVAR